MKKLLSILLCIIVITVNTLICAGENMYDSSGGFQGDLVEVMKKAMDLCSSYRYHEQVNIKFDFSDLINDMYSILSEYDESELEEYGIEVSPVSVSNIYMSWEKDVFYDLKRNCFYSVKDINESVNDRKFTRTCQYLFSNNTFYYKNNIYDDWVSEDIYDEVIYNNMVHFSEFFLNILALNAFADASASLNNPQLSNYTHIDKTSSQDKYIITYKSDEAYLIQAILLLTLGIEDFATGNISFACIIEKETGLMSDISVIADVKADIGFFEEIPITLELKGTYYDFDKDFSEIIPEVGKVNAENSPIKEEPKVKVLVDGKRVSYDGLFPIKSNSSILVPLDTTLSSLGIRDDQYSWDKNNQTAEINNGRISVVIKAGSTTAYVNGNEVKLIEPPVIYNNVLYAPVRFIAESFGKKVVWDDESKTVAICEQEAYEMVCRILEEANSAIMNIARYKAEGYDESIYYGIAQFINNKGGNIGINLEIDNENRKGGVTLWRDGDITFPFKEYLVSYYVNNDRYTSFEKNPQEWSKWKNYLWRNIPKSTEFLANIQGEFAYMKNIIGESHDPDSLLEKSKNNFNFLVYTWGELLYAGLTPVIKPDEGIIILEGDIGLSLSGDKTNSCYTAHSQIIIDISTGCFKQIKSEEENVYDSSGDMHSRNIWLIFKNINGDFQIDLP